MIYSNANLDIVDKNGNTPLILGNSFQLHLRVLKVFKIKAIKNGQSTIATNLIYANASLNIVDNSGNTALLIGNLIQFHLRV